MDEFLITFSSVLLFLTIYLSYKCYMHSIDKELFEQVSFCIYDGSMLTRMYRKPIGLVMDMQHKLNLPDHYRISGQEELCVVEEILNQFRSDLAQRYFAGHILPIHGKYVVPDEEFFMYTLCDFLLNYRISNSQHELVYYKLFHIAGCVRNNSKAIAEKSKAAIGFREIKDYLDTSCK